MSKKRLEAELEDVKREAESLLRDLEEIRQERDHWKRIARQRGKVSDVEPPPTELALLRSEITLLRGDYSRNLAQQRRADHEVHKQKFDHLLQAKTEIDNELMRMQFVLGQIAELARSAQPALLVKRLKDLSPHLQDRAARAKTAFVSNGFSENGLLVAYVGNVQMAIEAALQGDGGAALRRMIGELENPPKFGGRPPGMKPGYIELAERAARCRETTPGATWAAVGTMIIRELLAIPTRNENEQWMLDQLGAYCKFEDEEKPRLNGVAEPEKLASYLRQNQRRAALDEKKV